MSVVQLVRHGEVAEVILSRPEKHNAVIPETLTELIRIGKLLRRDRNLRAVIIRGDGPMVVSFTTVLVLVFIVSNLLVDLLYAALDPRIRYA